MANSINSNNAASNNVTTSAYLTLVASTSIAFNKIIASDTTGKIIKLAVGDAGHEVDLFQLPVSGLALLPLPSVDTVPVGSRLSIKAIDANATSGYTVVTLLS